MTVATLRYPLSLRILHWLIALLIITLLAVGLIMTGLPRDNPLRATVYNLHKSFGLTVLALAALRFVLRLSLGAPPLPDSIPKIERGLAHLAHFALYGFMFLMPLSGYAMTAFHGFPVRWFGLPLPKLLPTDRTDGALAADLHQWAAYLLIALITLHVGAVILHYFKHHTNLLTRMR